MMANLKTTILTFVALFGPTLACDSQQADSRHIAEAMIAANTRWLEDVEYHCEFMFVQGTASSLDAAISGQYDHAGAAASGESAQGAMTRTSGAFRIRQLYDRSYPSSSLRSVDSGFANGVLFNSVIDDSQPAGTYDIRSVSFTESAGTYFPFYYVPLNPTCFFLNIRDELAPRDPTQLETGPLLPTSLSSLDGTIRMRFERRKAAFDIETTIEFTTTPPIPAATLLHVKVFERGKLVSESFTSAEDFQQLSNGCVVPRVLKTAFGPVIEAETNQSRFVGRTWVADKIRPPNSDDFDVSLRAETRIIGLMNSSSFEGRGFSVLELSADDLEKANQSETTAESYDEEQTRSTPTREFRMLDYVFLFAVFGGVLLIGVGILTKSRNRSDKADRT